MKKILKIFTFVCVFFMTYMGVAYSDTISSIKYTAITKQNNMPSQVITVYKKGEMKKIVSSDSIIYMNLTTNDSTVYTPTSKTAMKISYQPNDIMPSNETINEYKSYPKSGTKTINKHTCTVYQNTSKGIEACISDTYDIPIYIKTPQYEMKILNISINTLSDSEFQLPPEVKILDMDSYKPSKIK